MGKMTINPFDESPLHREIVAYDKAYEKVFSRVKALVESSIHSVRLFHIGSTAIPDLRGKPMVDIVAVSERDNLKDEQAQLLKLRFHKRDVWVDTEDKPYVCGSVVLNGSTYNINIHICHEGDWIHREGLRFVEALRKSAALRKKYEQAKDLAHSIAPSDPEKYNRAKERAINEIYQQIGSRR